MADRPTCRTCRHCDVWSAYENKTDVGVGVGSGHCRHDPPHFTETRHGWPTVNVDVDWCRRHELPDVATSTAEPFDLDVFAEWLRTEALVAEGVEVAPDLAEDPETGAVHGTVTVTARGAQWTNPVVRAGVDNLRENVGRALEAHYSTVDVDTIFVQWGP